MFGKSTFSFKSFFSGRESKRFLRDFVVDRNRATVQNESLQVGPRRTDRSPAAKGFPGN